MNDKCFALRNKGMCGALSGSCSGYAGCAFYKRSASRKRISAGQTRGSGGCPWNSRG